jgi:large subunit ribosomal protein L32
MGLPSKRRTKTSKLERASHFALKPKALGTCAKCGRPVLPHRACAKCGTYKNREVVKIRTRAKTLKQKEENKKAAKKK